MKQRKLGMKIPGFFMPIGPTFHAFMGALQGNDGMKIPVFFYVYRSDFSRIHGCPAGK
jgi:hypothetical protein